MAITSTLTPTESAAIENSWRDRTGRCARDQQLRAFGFAIYERWKNREPKWIRGGVILAEHDAVLEMRQLEKALARKGK